MLEQISVYLGKTFSINNEYVYLAIITVVSYILIKILTTIIFNLSANFNHNLRSRYIYKQKITLISNIIIFIMLFLIWEPQLKSLVTILSFISAGATIALREIIFNFFSGIYIKLKKPFKLEDRVEINGYKGDVIKISYLSFEILEIGNDVNAEQSTGKMIHLPNYLVLTMPLRNYVKPFKYIWDEMTVKIPIDSNLQNAKKVIYRIVNNNQTVKLIPQKMKNQINTVSADYRIYFNKFNPVIYTKVVDSHIELSIRFLIHPKKVRTVEDEIWGRILASYQAKEIDLYIEKC